MPKLHPRYLPVVKARSEITAAVDKLIVIHELTSIEYLQILTEMQQSELKYMLRNERHPNNPDTRADESGEWDEKEPFNPHIHQKY